MRRLLFGAALVAALIGLSSCGGNGGGTSTHPDSRGVSVTIHWPARARLVPLQANFVRFKVVDAASTVVDTFYGKRPDNFPGETATKAQSGVVPSGTYKITAEAFNEDPRDAASKEKAPLAIGAQGNVEVLDGQTTKFGITMGSQLAKFLVQGLGSSFTLSESGASSAVAIDVAGGTKTVTVTPQDADGNVLLLAPTATDSTILVPEVGTGLTIPAGTIKTFHDTSASDSNQWCFLQFDIQPLTDTPTSYLQVKYVDGTSSSTVSTYKTTVAVTATSTQTVNVSVSGAPKVFDLDSGGNSMSDVRAQATLVESGADGKSYSLGTYTNKIGSGPATNGVMIFEIPTVTNRDRTFVASISLQLKTADGSYVELKKLTSSAKKLTAGGTTFDLATASVSSSDISLPNGSFILDRNAAGITLKIPATVSGSSVLLPTSLLSISGVPSYLSLTGSNLKVTNLATKATTNVTGSFAVAFRSQSGDIATGTEQVTVKPNAGSGIGVIN